MKTRQLKIIFVIILLSPLAFTGCLAKSGASGYEIIQSGETWYYPMVIDGGDTLHCEFHTDVGLVEYFIIDEDEYVENATLPQELLLHHTTKASDDFMLSIPYSDGWFWVFINHNPYEIKVTYVWEALSPTDYIPPEYFVGSIVLVSLILMLGIVFRLRHKLSNIVSRMNKNNIKSLSFNRDF